MHSFIDEASIPCTKKATCRRLFYKWDADEPWLVLLSFVDIGWLDVEGTLTDTLAQIVELGATHLATTGDFDPGYARCVQRENTLDTLAG